jgi:hypothetical protein
MNLLLTGKTGFDLGNQANALATAEQTAYKKAHTNGYA